MKGEDMTRGPLVDAATGYKVRVTRRRSKNTRDSPASPIFKLRQDLQSMANPSTPSYSTEMNPPSQTQQHHSPFLDRLPPELRLQIYTHLLVTPLPLKGTHARATTKYSLHTSILRTNRQIHTEALPIFLGKNTFHITTIPPSLSAFETIPQNLEGDGALEPPLQLRHLHLVRSLEIDLLFYPPHLRIGCWTDRWHPVSPGAKRYVTSLSFLLRAATHLRKLEICADVRPYLSCAWAGGRGVDYKKYITGFWAADGCERFRSALEGLKMDVGLRFEFEEVGYVFEGVEIGNLGRWGFVKVAGEVLGKRSEVVRRIGGRDGVLGNLCCGMTVG